MFVGEIQHKDEIADYLLKKIKSGRNFFKTSEIASDLKLKSCVVGRSMGLMKKDLPTGLMISAWGATNTITWKVELREENYVQETA